MSLPDFSLFVSSPVTWVDMSLAISASRSGGVGLLDARYGADRKQLVAALNQMEHPHKGAKNAYGLQLDSLTADDVALLSPYFDKKLQWLVLSGEAIAQFEKLSANFSSRPRNILVECIDREVPKCVANMSVDGVIIKGNESGGDVGEDSSFILLQHWVKQTDLPLFVRGGVTPHVSAALSAMGIAGGVLDSQMLLLDESPVASSLQRLLAPLSGSETVAVGDGEKGHYFRVLNHPKLKKAKAFIAQGETLGFKDVKQAVAQTCIHWFSPEEGLLPVGHDVCFAESWRKHYGKIPALFKAFRDAVENYPKQVRSHPVLTENSPLAQTIGTQYPIIQGPMTRVSDVAGFANAIAEGGALPMLAFALMRADKITELLTETKELLGSKPWGIGLLGFIPPKKLEAQIKAALPFKPNYAIIAGGRPDQAVAMEAQGIPSYLHLPSANLLSSFLKGGARRFIFEGRECGGHIGPLSSFTLWSTMIDRLVGELDTLNIAGEEVQCIFAGGIHDAYSSALLQVMVAPLAARNVNIGIIMGSAYLFTEEIVASGSIVKQFQETVLQCRETVNLESGPGHASRCAYTPFAKTFFDKRRQLKSENTPADAMRHELDDMILGTLRVASKAKVREGDNLVDVPVKEQKQTGMYMLGQVVPLRKDITTVRDLHKQVTEGAAELLQSLPIEEENHSESNPAEIAIVGMNCVLPGANDGEEYWQNILDKIDTITEIPKERWDWRLYFNEDRNAKDGIYSKWGGFMEDMPFDPMKYGITPKSLTSVDPMQLMTLEVTNNALEDARVDMNDARLRSKTSVIIGASGGTGDVGSQYTVRAEMPRFAGKLDNDLAEQLPDWSEDTFAGILMNVVPGRIANRLNLGGVNYAVDAACASSLSAVYQGVGELLNGNSDMVIAGGIDTVQDPFSFMCFSQTQALSPTGRCRTFDESSDGIVISEGIVMLVMKRLEDAERDGDKIYAVIKGAGGGSDGKAKGLSAPLPDGQLRTMKRAYERAGYSASTVGLFEAHGTGTKAGDTSELKSTTALVSESGAGARNAVVGSVKTMIGHTKATAGVAGMMKAALALHHKVIPPHFGVKNPNEKLKDANAPLYIIDEAEPWVHGKDYPRRASVSAFGFGGTNFHVTMEEYQGEFRNSRKSSPRKRLPAELCVWSAASVEDMKAQLNDLRSQLTDEVDLELRDVANMLADSWARDNHCLAMVASDIQNLKALLQQTLAHLDDSSNALPKGVYYADQKQEGKLAVLFPGQGSQYTQMLRDVSLQFPIATEILSEADAALTEAFTERFGENRPLSSFIFPRGAYDADTKKQAEENLKSTDVAQPALGAVEAAMWRVAQRLGIHADMFAGHSYGEFVAHFAAGKISFNDLMLISEARGRLIVDKAKEAGAELGTMAAVKATRKEVETAIKDIKNVIVANHNAATQVIISGSSEGVKRATEALKASGKRVVILPVSAAFHSTFVEPAREGLGKVIASSHWQQGDDVAVYSNETGKPHVDDLATVKNAMANHLIHPVEFVKQIEQMHEDGARVFLELGPKAVLSKLVGSILKGKPYHAIAIDEQGGDVAGMMHALAQLVCAGVDVNLAELFRGRDCVPVTMKTLASTRRHAAIPKHAWMINGSGVRRMSEPAKQIGITLEQFEAKTPPTPEPVKTMQEKTAMPASANAAPERPSVQRPSRRLTRRSTSTRVQPRESFYMRNNETYADEESAEYAPESSVTQAYFDLVSQQLNNARDVALAELGFSPASAPLEVSESSRKPARRVSSNTRRPAAPLPRAVAMPANQSAPSRTNVVSMPKAAEPKPATAAPTQAPKVATVASASVAVASAPAPEVFGKAEITNVILEIVAEKTGYEADMIGFDQNLEADLGVDSIKRVDIVSGVLDKLPAAIASSITDEKRSSLSTANTLDDMLKLLDSGGVSASSEPTNVSGSVIDDAALKAIMLDIVTEKTGYEADMIAFDQNLEADLGVDSIKRVDIVSGVLDKLPAETTSALGDEGRSKLSTSANLAEMLTVLKGAVSANFSQAGVENTTVASETSVSGNRPLRLNESRAVMRAKQEPLPANAVHQLTEGTFLVVGDSNGVTDKLISRLQDIVALPESALANEEALVAWCESEGKALQSLAGIIHLAAIGQDHISADANPDSWQQVWFRSEKSLFLLVKHLTPNLKSDAHVLVATSLGGTFARENAELGLQLQGGSVGMIKSLCKEREQLRGKAVDVDNSQSAELIADEIYTELSLVGGRQEVGYPKGVRTIFQTVYTPIEDSDITVDDRDLIVLATGGARGVTAEVLREVAKAGNTIILTGRSPLPAMSALLRETPELAGLETEKELTRYFVKSESLPLGDARKQAGKVIAAREIYDNIADFEKAGASVHYHAVDVSDDAAMKALMETIYQTYGNITTVVHGAGIIEDKFLADITSESWSRVVNTKVVGLLLLQKYVKTEHLKHFIVFSSVAGRYGNTGQSNYATANELMNRICSQLQCQWGDKVKVAAMCWGPWGKTKFGVGMVTDATEAKFAKSGVYLVTAELGRLLFTKQIVDAANIAEVEIICGEAPWEASEAKRGAIRLSGAQASLLADAEIKTLSDDTLSTEITLHAAQPYLQDHIIDEHPVFPMAVAMEAMAEAVQKGFGDGWQIAAIMNAKLFKGVFVTEQSQPLTVQMAMTSHGMDGTSTVDVKIVSEKDGKKQPHYGATVVLSPALSQIATEVPQIAWKNKRSITPKEAYDNWLFHGKTFQVIERIEAFSEQGAECVVRTTQQADLIGSEANGGWLFDPAIVDAAAHMSVLWMAVLRGSFALPMSFGRVSRYTDEALPAKLTMHYVVVEETKEALTADVFFTDENGQVLLQIESMQHMVSHSHSVKALNKAA